MEREARLPAPIPTSFVDAFFSSSFSFFTSYCPRPPQRFQSADLQPKVCPKLCQTISPLVSYLRELVADLEALFQDVLVGALVLLEDLVDQVAAVDLGAAEARQEGRRACTTVNHRYEHAAQRERSFAAAVLTVGARDGDRGDGGEGAQHDILAAT